MGVEVEVTDSGATGLERRLGELDQELTIGVHEDAPPYLDGTAVATIGSAHEFGVGVPQRSWLRGWVDSGGQSVIANEGQRQVEAVVDRAAPSTVSEVVGAASVKGILDRMAGGLLGTREDGTAALADLDDSGRLRDSIAWEPAKP